MLIMVVKMSLDSTIILYLRSEPLRGSSSGTWGGGTPDLSNLDYHSHQMHEGMLIMVALMSLHSTINPIIFGCRSSKFRQKFTEVRNILRFSLFFNTFFHTFLHYYFSNLKSFHGTLFMLRCLIHLFNSFHNP